MGVLAFRSRNLWVSVACVLPCLLLYQNTGWFQFGYRFALDIMLPLLLLLAVADRPMGRGFRFLIAVGVAVNLLGAATFDRHPGFYDFDRGRLSRAEAPRLGGREAIDRVPRSPRA